jgi:hypothetical protein
MVNLPSCVDDPRKNKEKTKKKQKSVCARFFSFQQSSGAQKKPTQSSREIW